MGGLGSLGDREGTVFVFVLCGLRCSVRGLISVTVNPRLCLSCTSSVPFVFSFVILNQSCRAFCSVAHVSCFCSFLSLLDSMRLLFNVVLLSCC